jgi:cation transport ATPase
VNPKETSAEAIEKLHEEGIRIVRLTGNNQVTAKAVADRLGTDVAMESARVTLVKGDLRGDRQSQASFQGHLA